LDESILDRVYAAAMDDQALFEVLDYLTERSRSRGAGLFMVRDGALVWERSVGMPDRFMEVFTRHYAPSDPRLAYLMSFPVHTVVSDHHPELRRLMAETPVLEFAESHDLPYTTGAHLLRDRGGVMAMYFSRSQADGRPDDRASRQLEALAPHMARSMQLRRMGRTLSRSCRPGGSSRALHGRMFVDLQGRVRWLDAEAEEIVSRLDLARFGAVSLLWRHRPLRDWFERSMDMAREHRRFDWPVQLFQRPLKGVRGELRVRFLPAFPDQLPPELFESARSWICLALSWRARRARHAPSLSPRQSEALILLGRGLNSTEVAHQLGCAPATARNHAQALLEKFGANSRVEMLRRARHFGFIP